MNTAGYMRLWTLITNLMGASSSLEQAIFERWTDRRRNAFNAELRNVCRDERVRGFFEDYSIDLASQLEPLLTEGPVAEPAQTAIDYLEGLFTQTIRYATSLAGPQPVTDAANQPMAMAA